MNILWITNIVFPEALSLLNSNGVLKSSGGWMLGAAEALLQLPDVKLTVASVSRDVHSLTHLKGDKIEYWLLPYGKGNIRKNSDYNAFWREVQKKAKADIVHIHGTEYSHGLSYVEECGSNNVCVSIQGLVSACQYYYHYGITRGEIRRSITPASIRIGGILSGVKDFKHRSECEKELLHKVKHVLGRTLWDKSLVWAINPLANYYYCGEILRGDFYNFKKWSYDNCTAHSIFLSQGASPFKGLHMVLRSLPIILKHYPDTIVRVAGKDITKCNSIKEFFRLSDYGNIIRTIIKENSLEGHVIFTGELDSVGMCEEYLRSNVFVCPSSIENSPNSLAEAQILGVPVIASYVGGIPTMMKGDEDHMYRFEDIETLAYLICEVFAQNNGINTETMRQKALCRHDPTVIVNNLMSIYCEIIGKKVKNFNY